MNPGLILFVSVSAPVVFYKTALKLGVESV